MLLLFLLLLIVGTETSVAETKSLMNSYVSNSILDDK